MSTIQFRVNKEEDKDIIHAFSNHVLQDLSVNKTERAKELLRLGLEYENLKKTKQDVAPQLGEKPKLTAMQQNFKQITIRMKGVQNVHGMDAVIMEPS